MKKTLTAILFLTTVILTACHVGTSGTFVNANISADIKQQVEPLNKKLIEGLVSKNTDGIKKLMAPILIKSSGSKLSSILDTISAGITTTEYTVIDEYYTKNTTTNISNTLMSGIGTASGYILHYLALNKEMFAAVISVKTEIGTGLILAVYGKYDDGWKLNILNAGAYQLLGKTAPDYYNKAKQYYNKGELLDATNNIVLASQIATPGGAYFKYKTQDSIKAFYEKVVGEINQKYKLPMGVTEVKTHPQILSVTPQYISGAEAGFYPYIAYKSNINLKDTSALKTENKALQTAMANLFKGLTQNNKYILYRAFKDMPGPAASKESYGFVQKVK